MKNYLESLSVFWKEDEKSTSKCAESIYDFLVLLKNHNEILFSKWYEQSTSRKEALKNKLKLNQSTYNKIVEDNWDKKFQHLGSSFTIWTGNDEGYSASISFRLGAYGDKPHIKSSCVISFPYLGEQVEHYKEDKNKQDIVSLMVNYWKPNKILINGEPLIKVT